MRGGGLAFDDTKVSSPDTCDEGRIHLVDGRFQRDGDPWAMLAVNYIVDIRHDAVDGYYIGPHHAYCGDNLCCMTSADCLTALQADLATIRAMGFNAIRLVGMAGLYRDGIFSMVTIENVLPSTQHEGPLLELVTALGSDGADLGMTLSLIGEVVDHAGAAGLSVLHLSGHGALDEPQAIPLYTHYLGALANELREEPSYAAIDLWNEPGYAALDRIPDKVSAIGWVRAWADAVHTAAPLLLVTMGLTDADTVRGWDPGVLPLDFVTYHPYPYRPFEGVRQASYEANLQYFSRVGVPWAIGETGSAGIPYPLVSDRLLIARRMTMWRLFIVPMLLLALFHAFSSRSDGGIASFIGGTVQIGEEHENPAEVAQPPPTEPAEPQEPTACEASWTIGPSGECWRWSIGPAPSTVRMDATASLLSDGRVLLTGGITHANEMLADRMDSAELYDPTTSTWTSTGSMNVFRFGYTATPLADGRILIAGGISTFADDESTAIERSAERYDPATGTFSTVAPSTCQRAHHRALRLPDGRVLVQGGVYSEEGGDVACEIELYDPSTDRWTTGTDGDPDGIALYAVLLLDGRVLLIGRDMGVGNVGGECFIYDPTSDAFTPTGSLVHPLIGLAATTLLDGRVLVVGGHTGRDGYTPTYVSGSELWDPATGQFREIDGPQVARRGATLVALPGGRIMVVGGRDVAVTEVFDPTTERWFSSGSLSLAREGLTATVLNDGDVLIAGGGEPRSLSMAELFDPASGTFHLTGSMVEPVGNHGAVLLPDGRVLVVGGDIAYSVNSQVADRGQLYDPTTGQWTATGPLSVPRQRTGVALMADDQVLVTGGEDGLHSNTGRYEVDCFDPSTNQWVPRAPLTQARTQHASLVLPDGSVLVAGGRSYTYEYLDSAERYDLATNRWMDAGKLDVARYRLTATRMHDGRVIFIGGSSHDYPVVEVASTCLFDPATGTFTRVSPIPTQRIGYVVVELTDGRLLVAGGFLDAQPLSSVEIYDPVSDTWTEATPMNHPRGYLTGTLLRDGQVLVTGGLREDPIGAELYDPGSDTWTDAATMNLGRYSHTATMLQDGRMLIAGGYHITEGLEYHQPINSTERFTWW